VPLIHSPLAKDDVSCEQLAFSGPSLCFHTHSGFVFRILLFSGPCGGALVPTQMPVQLSPQARRSSFLPFDFCPLPFDFCRPAEAGLLISRVH
jgi:hypothetical protein